MTGLRIAAIASGIILLVVAISYAVFSPDPESSLATFQEENPNYQSESEQYAENLTFKQGWLGHGCEDFDNSKLENAGLFLLDFSPFAPVGELRRIYRGFQGLAGSEACIHNMQPAFAAQLMKADATQPINKSLSVTASSLCDLQIERRERVTEITEAIIGLGANKVTKFGGKMIQQVLESATGTNLPLADEFAAQWIEHQAASLVPNPPNHAQFKQDACHLEKALQPNWGNDIRSEISAIKFAIQEEL